MADKGKGKGIIPFIRTAGAQSSPDGDLVETGTVGNLKYSVYKRGVIHILDKDEKRAFRKDVDLFEDEINKAATALDTMPPDQEHVVKGSGDNDDLVFKYDDGGDVTLELRRKGLRIIESLRNLVSKARVAKAAR